MKRALKWHFILYFDLPRCLPLQCNFQQHRNSLLVFLTEKLRLEIMTGKAKGCDSWDLSSTYNSGSRPTQLRQITIVFSFPSIWDYITFLLILGLTLHFSRSWTSLGKNQKCFCHLVVEGQHTDFNQDFWLPWLAGFKLCITVKRLVVNRMLQSSLWLQQYSN